MKKLLFFLCLLPVMSLAQPGYIHTIIGTGIAGFSGDGGLATAAQIGEVLGNTYVDAAGTIFFIDNGNLRIRKVTTSGVISTVAGGGSSTADGIPATSASLGFYGDGNMTGDAMGNLYVADNHRIRKISATTGIITTVAGTLTAGYSGDGGPATAAKLNSPIGICFDAAGNMYIGDEDNYRIRKVSTTGIISTYAGIGTYTFSGDGGPATAAAMRSPDGLCMDPAGNLYFADRYNYRIRKINTAGIISTYAGNGSYGFSGDGGPATAASFGEPSDVCMDSYGNLYVADFHNGRVRKIDPSGIITTFAGGGSSMSSGIPATSDSFTDVWHIGIDPNDNIYVSDRNHYRIGRIGFGMPTIAGDTFSLFVTNSCTSINITCRSNTFYAGQHVRTYYGDGTYTDNALSALAGGYGIATISKPYNFSGTYALKHILFNGSTAIDSVSYSWDFSPCQSFKVNFYYDADNSCTKDGTEPLFHSQIVTEIDSNGVPIDTISSTSGFNYLGYGNIGTVYKFKVISSYPGVQVTCPSTGYINDTLVPGVQQTDLFGLGCSISAAGFDLKINPTVVVTGVRDQWGHIYVRNSTCASPSATITLNYSPKYHYRHSVPAETSVSGTTITYDIGSVSVLPINPIDFMYGLENPASGPLTPGDTVNLSFMVTPTTGDSDFNNNVVIRTDTVKAGCDPNFIEVDKVCIETSALPAILMYTIHFENTGNDTAHNIYVLDTLPDNVDASSVIVDMSSHDMFVSRSKDATGHTILKFDFPKINLLDSSHRGLCDGMFIYYARTKPGLTTGMHIMSRAGIYFDVNDVVMTNEAETKIGDCPLPPTGVVAATTGNDITVYPNPATNILHIENRHSSVTYRIVNVIGATVIDGSLQQGANTVSLQPLIQGVYTIELVDFHGNRIVKKVVKE